MSRIRLARSLVMALVLGCAVQLALTSTASTGVRLLANALIMDGTTFPMPSPGYMDSAINDFIAPTAPIDGDTYQPVAVRTPEHIVGIDQSVDDGIADLEDAMAANQCSEPGQSCVVFGFSQSTVITMREKAELQKRMAQGEKVPDITFVGIGVGNRPNGGIAERFSGIVIPFFDFTFNGPSPDDPEHPITTIDIARQYDGLADTPQFVTNPVSDANAILGVVFVHALYGEEISLDENSPKYVKGTVKEVHGDTTYYWIPTADLPLFDPLRIAGVPEPAIDVFEPFFKVLVEAGYDRSVPFSEPTPAQLFPVVDPVTFSIELAGAVVDGADNAAKIVGVQLPGYAAVKDQLAAAQASSADTIGAPYREAVTTINKTVNPIQIFAAVEGPVVSRFNDVVNDAGVPAALNRVLDPVIPPVTAWAEDNVLFPRRDKPAPPLANVARQILKRVAPRLETGSASSDSRTERKQAQSEARPDRPAGAKRTQRTDLPKRFASNHIRHERRDSSAAPR